MVLDAVALVLSSLWFSGEEIDSGDSSQDATPLVPQGLEDTACLNGSGWTLQSGHCDKIPSGYLT